MEATIEDVVHGLEARGEWLLLLVGVELTRDGRGVVLRVLAVLVWMLLHAREMLGWHALPRRRREKGRGR